MGRVAQNPDSKDYKPTFLVSAKLPEGLYNYIENWRWDNRFTKSQVIVNALTEWAKDKGYVEKIPEKVGSKSEK